MRGRCNCTLNSTVASPHSEAHRLLKSRGEVKVSKKRKTARGLEEGHSLSFKDDEVVNSNANVVEINHERIFGLGEFRGTKESGSRDHVVKVEEKHSLVHTNERVRKDSLGGISERCTQFKKSRKRHRKEKSLG